MKIRAALRQLAKQYRIRYADFVEEFVLEVPTFIAASTFFIHGSGLASILTPKDLDTIIQHVTEAGNMRENEDINGDDSGSSKFGRNGMSNGMTTASQELEEKYN